MSHTDDIIEVMHPTSTLGSDFPLAPRASTTPAEETFLYPSPSSYCRGCGLPVYNMVWCHLTYPPNCETGECPVDPLNPPELPAF